LSVIGTLVRDDDSRFFTLFLIPFLYENKTET
jgi:hypothetical protein